MVEFKVGDRVRNISGNSFSNGGFEATVNTVNQDQIWLQETGTWIEPRCIELVTPEPKSTNPFLKTVTETRVVDGSHVFESSGADIQIEVGRNDVMIRTDAFYDKQSLAELARILAEISENMA